MSIAWRLASALDQPRAPRLLHYGARFATHQLKSTPNTRLEALSPLRFIAAFLVVITHTTFYIKERVDNGFTVWHFGEIGVPIFFVISGVVMIWTGSKTPINSDGAVDFIIKRLIRIVPLYWLATGVKIAATLLNPSLINHNHFEFLYAVKSVLFIPAFNSAGEVRPIHGVGWTLLHEMFFYTLFSASLFLKIRPIFSLSIAIPLLTLIGSIFPVESAVFKVITSTYNLYFVVGMLVGWVISEGSARRQAVVLTLGLAAGLQWTISAKWLDPSVLLIAAAIVLTAGLPRISWLQPAARLGDSSYALYLFHPFIAPAAVVTLAKVMPMQTGIIVGLTLVGTVAICHLIHLTVENKLTHYAKLFFKDVRMRFRTQ